MGKQPARLSGYFIEIKGFILLAMLLWCGYFSAQQVTLSKIVDIYKNPDKTLYKVRGEGSRYLGEVEIAGYSESDAEVFSMIYKKAKQIGANSFSLKDEENIDGARVNFDKAHYFLKLYYTDEQSLPNEHNVVYVISPKKQKITLNGKTEQLSARSFRRIPLQPGGMLEISTRHLLGSNVRLGSSEGQPVQYFQISGFRIGQNYNGTPGLNIKSGDIIKLERSFAEFLTVIYDEIK